MKKESNKTCSYKHRSAVTGKYVKKAVATKHPRTTVKEKSCNKKKK